MVTIIKEQRQDFNFSVYIHTPILNFKFRGIYIVEVIVVSLDHFVQNEIFFVFAKV